MKEKINDKIREIINKWLKKQATYSGLMGCGNNGYIVTNSQAQKLKKELWRNINFFNSTVQDLHKTRLELQKEAKEKGMGYEDYVTKDDSLNHFKHR